MWAFLGYEDVSVLGRIALGFDEDSLLQDHPPLGTLITWLDDIALGGSGAEPGANANANASRENCDEALYFIGTYRLTNEGEKSIMDV